MQIGFSFFYVVHRDVLQHYQLSNILVQVVKHVHIKVLNHQQKNIIFKI